MSEKNETTATVSKCANPDCQENGKLKCAACSVVYYCSAQCQKKHWPNHKAQCKTAQSKSSTTTTATATTTTTTTNKDKANTDTTQAQLQALKSEIQKHFSQGDFDTAIKKSDEALQLTKALPALIAISETIQLHINLSTAYIHLNRNSDAEFHADQAVRNAEIAVTQRPNQPQPIEVLSIALGSRAVALLTNNKIETALEAAQRSLALAESIYPKNDQRLHKSLRTLGLILDKKGDTSAAESTLFKAYTIVSLAVGPHAGEAQLLTEDLVGLFARKGDFENAEKYARRNYNALKDKKLSGTEKAIYADSVTRLANTLLRKGDHLGAESLVIEALAIRESTEFSSQNPLGIAFSLSQLVAIREALNKVDNESEAMLMRALDIFSRLKGPNSPEVINTLNQLKNLKSKKKLGGAVSSSTPSISGVTVEDVDEDDDESAVVESKKSGITSTKPATSSSSPARGASSSPVPPSTTTGGKKLPKTNYDITPEERKKIDSLPKDDGVSRMQLAGYLYEQNKFATAELLLSQAVTIFQRSYGPDHEHTKAAKQNLGLVRNNRLNQLWTQVVAEEILALEELKISDSVEEVNSPKAGKNGNNTPSASEGSYSKAVNGQGASNDVQLTLEERLFLQTAEKEKPQSSCVIC